MTFTYKLSRRLAASLRQAAVALGAGLAVAACSTGNDFTSPEPGLDTAVAAVKIFPESATLALDEPLLLVSRGWTGRDTVDVEVDWSSNGGTISETGLFSSATTGKFKVVGRTRNRYGAFDSAIILVEDRMVSVQVSPDTATLRPGQSLQLTAKAAGGTPLPSRTISWTSSPSSVASVSTSGLVTALASGTSTITATVGKARGSARIAVIPAVALLEVTPAAVALQPRGTVQLTATPRDSSGDVLGGRTISWSSSNGSIASVSLSGVVTAVSVGATTVIATCEGKAGTTSVSVSDPAPSPSGQRTQYGLHMDLTYYGIASVRTQAIANAKAVNAKISRNSFMWSYIERQRGIKDWSVPDAVVSELLANGIEPLMVVVGSPSWANGVSTSTPDWEFYVPTTEPAFSAWVDNYKAFMTESALRYKGKVHKWELWNEQNETYFWKPAPNIDHYAQWYTAVYQAIKAVDPTAEVSSGGLAGLVAGCCITGHSFLQGLYDRGIRPDIVAIHPYALKEQAPDVHLPWESNFDDIAAIHSLMVANGEGSKPIWATEWGWNSAAIGEVTQAAYVKKSLEMIASLYPYVTIATYFLDYDRGQYTQGLYDASFRMKPSGAAFRDFLLTH
jgi:uncharacterized protein YjdB